MASEIVNNVAPEMYDERRKQLDDIERKAARLEVLAPLVAVEDRRSLLHEGRHRLT